VAPTPMSNRTAETRCLGFSIISGGFSGDEVSEAREVAGESAVTMEHSR
jgi:hypothetical protein